MRKIENVSGARRYTFILLMFAFVLILIGWVAISTGRVQKVTATNGLVTENPADADTESNASAPVFVCVTPPSGMINWYPGDGNANDIRGGRNGTLRNGAAFAPGKVLQAFSLDGVNDYVDVGDLDLPATFTIDAWIRPSGFPGGFPHILDKDSVIDERSYYFRLDNRRLELLVIRNNPFAATRYRTTAAVVTGDEWQLVAATYDGGAAAGQRIKFYRNGVNIPAEVIFGQDSGGTPDNNSFPARIGQDSAENGFAFNGLIDELETFNRVLSAAELQQIFAADIDGKCKPGGVIPTPTPTPTPNPTPTRTPTPTPTPNSTPTPTPTPGTCAFTINPPTQSFPPTGGSGTVMVTQTSGGPPCPWTAVSSPSFVPVVIAAASGMGNGSFTFTVSPNETAEGRSGTVNLITDNPDGTRTVRATFTASQPVGGGTCTFTPAPPVVTFDSDSGSSSVMVTTQNGCDWTPISTQPSWLIVTTPGIRSGTGPVSFSVSENTGQNLRTGQITFRGGAVSVEQDGTGACPLLFIFCLLQNQDVNCTSARNSSDEPNQFRGFRDNVLAKTGRGKKYTDDYYVYAGEITRLMIFNPSLLFRSKDVIERYQPVLESVLRRERAKAEQERTGVTASPVDLEPTVVFDSEIDDVTELLAAFSAKASGGLRETLGDLQRDIKDSQVQAEFGVRIEHGEKRPLPGKSTLETISKFTLFDFGSRIEFFNPFSKKPPPR